MYCKIGYVDPDNSKNKITVNPSYRLKRQCFLTVATGYGGGTPRLLGLYISPAQARHLATMLNAVAGEVEAKNKTASI